MEQAKLELWEQRIQALENSGLNPRQWSLEQGIRLNQTYYWLHKLRKKDKESASSPQWVRLDPNHAHSTGVSLRIGDINLIVERGFDHQVLLEIIQTLMAIC